MIATTLTFLERYDELRDLGVPDWQIAKRMGLTLSLVRMLEKYDRPIPPLLRELADDERARQRGRAAS
ncbi:hypothetical protein HZU38_05515 [Mycolicibacterium vanbaalenii]|uniref:hypothetical protein n=1 Tax=Mycolicibacterium vanbaalenii TaxID=110539 RepID=UPI001F339F24|nr:hypothetical protein [Mycolicibacterium vanbaalenii]UJL29959.1 hypothetical protein HZU38_05515 [Mycolicibacterium vanbaalenii]WND56980.1 hypothetical protein QQA43_00760 [Mycolicibacterium vanbaalenii]